MSEKVLLETPGERLLRLRWQPVRLLTRVPERLAQLPHVKHFEQKALDERVPDLQGEVQVLLRVVPREAE